jgi:FkbM family methyltransferase
MNIKNDLDIDFDYISQKLKSGLKLRIDVGLSCDMGRSRRWINFDNNVFVIGIEPHPENCSSLKNLLSNTKGGDRFYLIESAIDDVEHPTSKEFYGFGWNVWPNNPGCSSLLKPIGRFENSTEKVYNVDVISLKSILDKIDYEFIEVLKTDTQGNDLNVIKSLGEHIQNVVFIDSEYDESDDYENANTGEELDIYLKENNFKKYQMVLQPTRDMMVEDTRYVNTLIKDIDKYSNDYTFESHEVMVDVK